MNIQKLLYLIFFLFLSSKLSAQNIFDFQNPFYIPESINKISYLNHTGWAMGNYGLILKTTDNGQTFFRQSISSKANFRRVFIVDSLFCCALDDSSRIFKTINGGNNWIYNSGFTTTINDMHFINQNTGFITSADSIGITSNSGLNWVFISPDNSSPYKYFDVNFINTQTGFVTALNLTTNYAIVFKTTNTGLNWTWYNSTVDAFEINNIYFLNAQTGWCAGSRFGNLFVMKTNNGGVNWIESPSTFNSFLPENLYFANNNTGYITSPSKIIKSTNGGANWFTLLNGIGFQSSYFVNDSVFYLADNNSRIFKTNNTGNSFDTLLGKQNTLLNKIQIINTGTLWCNGQNSANWKSINSGTNWMYDYYSNSLNIRYTSFLNINIGFAVADRGRLYKTTNFGNNWNTSFNYTGEIYSVHLLNSLTGWAFADTIILKTTNSGLNWSVLSNPDNILYANFFNEQIGYGYNGNNLLKTSDGGSNWSQISTDFITDYCFFNSLTGWTVSSIDTSAIIQQTTNGGINWSQVSVINGNISKIMFINQNTGYLLSFNKIYRTTNNGYNWKYVNFPTSLRIFAMALSDANTGWLCGDNSVIIKLINGSSIFVNTEIQSLSDFELYQNYPNPFNSETNITFTISKQAHTSLKIYDILGREVSVLINQVLTPNNYTTKFNASNLSSGIYLYVLNSDNKSITKKLVVLK